MVIFLYRWRIKAEFVEQFVENWSVVTEYYKVNCGSLGSRLHIGDDGFYYGYAQWLSAEDREKASLDADAQISFVKMREAVEQSFPYVQLEPVAGYLSIEPNGE